MMDDMFSINRITLLRADSLVLNCDTLCKSKTSKATVVPLTRNYLANEVT